MWKEIWMSFLLTLCLQSIVIAAEDSNIIGNKKMRFRVIKMYGRKQKLKETSTEHPVTTLSTTKPPKVKQEWKLPQMVEATEDNLPREMLTTRNAKSAPPENPDQFINLGELKDLGNADITKILSQAGGERSDPNAPAVVRLSVPISSGSGDSLDPSYLIKLIQEQLGADAQFTILPSPGTQVNTKPAAPKQSASRLTNTPNQPPGLPRSRSRIENSAPTSIPTQTIATRPPRISVTNLPAALQPVKPETLLFPEISTSIAMSNEFPKPTSAAPKLKYATLTPISATTPASIQTLQPSTANVNFEQPDVSTVRSFSKIPNIDESVREDDGSPAVYLNPPPLPSNLPPSEIRLPQNQIPSTPVQEIPVFAKEFLPIPRRAQIKPEINEGIRDSINSFGEKIVQKPAPKLAPKTNPLPIFTTLDQVMTAPDFTPAVTGQYNSIEDTLPPSTESPPKFSTAFIRGFADDVTVANDNPQLPPTQPPKVESQWRTVSEWGPGAGEDYLDYAGEFHLPSQHATDSLTFETNQRLRFHPNTKVNRFRNGSEIINSPSQNYAQYTSPSIQVSRQYGPPPPPPKHYGPPPPQQSYGLPRLDQLSTSKGQSVNYAQQRLPSTSYSAPSTSSGPYSSHASYGPPSPNPSYGAPSSHTSYGPPSPNPSYGPPSSHPSYGPPSSQPSYGPPILTDVYGPPGWNPGPLIAEKEPEITKTIYVNIPPANPPTPATTPRPHQIILPRKHYKIIFIKAPTPPPTEAPVVEVTPPPDTKTIIYVLHKKPEPPPKVDIKVPPTTKAPPPEVFFIQYKDQDKKGGNQAGHTSHQSAGWDTTWQSDHSHAYTSSASNGLNNWKAIDHGDDYQTAGSEQVKVQVTKTISSKTS